MFSYIYIYIYIVQLNFLNFESIIQIPYFLKFLIFLKEIIMIIKNHNKIALNIT